MDAAPPPLVMVVPGPLKFDFSTDQHTFLYVPSRQILLVLPSGQKTRDGRPVEDLAQAELLVVIDDLVDLLMGKNAK